MNIKYRMIRRYVLGVSAVMIGLLLALKTTKTGSSASINSTSKYEYKTDYNFANYSIESAQNAEYEKNGKKGQYTPEYTYDFEDTAYTPQKNYSLENGITEYSNYSVQVQNKGQKIVYLCNDTIVCIYEGGALPWRNNNPGALKYGDFAKTYGAIGKGNNNFAIFPTREVGVYALKALLQSDSYKNLSVSAAIETFAPPKENDTEKYKRRLAGLTGVNTSRKVSSLSDAEFERVAATIITLEGGDLSTRGVKGKETLFVNGNPITQKDMIVDTLVNQQIIK